MLIFTDRGVRAIADKMPVPTWIDTRTNEAMQCLMRPNTDCKLVPPNDPLGDEADFGG